MSDTYLRFDFLKNHPEYIQTCAQWSFEEWGRYTPERTFDDFLEARRKYARYDNRVPFTLLVFSDDRLVGICSLAETRGILPELSPWLAALYVDPAYRKQGIGKLLERKISEIADSMGYENLYCFTSDEQVISWYLSQGWQVRQKSWIHDHEVTVLEKLLIR